MFEWLMLEWLMAAAFAAAGTDAQALLQAADAPRAALEGQKVTIYVTAGAGGRSQEIPDIELFVGKNDAALAVFRDRKGRERMYLMRDGDTFLIAPGARHAVKIPPAQRLFGSASFAELARLRLDRDYDAKILNEHVSCGTETCREVEITAHEKSAPYASGILRLDDQGRMREADFRLASGKASKSVAITYQQDARGRSVPKRVQITDHLRPKDLLQTALEYSMPEPVVDDSARFDPERLLGANQ